MPVGAGMLLGMDKYVGFYLDGMKKNYLDALRRINNKDLHRKIYTNNRSHDGFDCLLNTIEHYHFDQMIREEKQDR